MPSDRWWRARLINEETKITDLRAQLQQAQEELQRLWLERDNCKSEYMAEVAVNEEWRQKHQAAEGDAAKWRALAESRGRILAAHKLIPDEALARRGEGE